MEERCHRHVCKMIIVIGLRAEGLICMVAARQERKGNIHSSGIFKVSALIGFNSFILSLNKHGNSALRFM